MGRGGGADADVGDGVGDGVDAAARPAATLKPLRGMGPYCRPYIHATGGLLLTSVTIAGGPTGDDAVEDADDDGPSSISTASGGSASVTGGGTAAADVAEADGAASLSGTLRRLAAWSASVLSASMVPYTAGSSRNCPARVPGVATRGVSGGNHPRRPSLFRCAACGVRYVRTAFEPRRPRKALEALCFTQSARQRSASSDDLHAMLQTAFRCCSVLCHSAAPLTALRLSQRCASHSAAPLTAMRLSQRFLRSLCFAHAHTRNRDDAGGGAVRPKP